MLGGGTLLGGMGVFGYAAFGKDCDSEILTNFDMSKTSVQIASFLLIIHLALYIPTAFVICRFYLLDLFNMNALEMESFPFIVTTLGLFISMVVTMAVIPLSDVGGSFSYIIDMSGNNPPLEVFFFPFFF